MDMREYPDPETYMAEAQLQEARALVSQAQSQAKAQAASQMKPVVTIVSALPPTTYMDEEDKTPKSLGYLKAQHAALDRLNKNAADQLTASVACGLTQSIDPNTQEPTAAEALRLCFYMRSIGYDVYHEIEDKTQSLTLYIVNQRSHIRSRKYDRPYWHQNFSTNQTHALFMSTTRASRRNAITFPADREEPQDILARAQAALRNIPDSEDLQEPQPEGDEAPPENPRTALETAYAHAEASLNAEFENPGSNPEAVESRIAEMEAIRLQIADLPE
ncbi:hypothetical protein CC86DRAFT_326263 [Ophiobolus disseminans]|uniref:Uncharacterized protein n=1 Tax=Ophiobolus disseminans TaxID=1469910 RepID=A0A6A6ZVQ7_9PLEO|nr:hypothetical protein CC86DRAFT_326263 [Ophiobolus disseminans]